MTDLLLWLLIAATLNNLIVFAFSYVKSKGVTWKFRKQEVFTYASSEPFYHTKIRKHQMRKYFFLNGAFYAVVNILVSNSFIEFAFTMILILVQYVTMYKIYVRQCPLFFVHEKGVSCQMIVHPRDRDHVGNIQWEEMEWMDFDLPESVKERIEKKIS